MAFLHFSKFERKKQELNYETLEKSDKAGESTAFIEFMLEIILTSLEELLSTQNISLTTIDRIQLFQSIVKTDLFSRKDYLKNFKEISSATASRYLKFAVENRIIEKKGDKNTARYKFRNIGISTYFDMVK